MSESEREQRQSGSDAAGDGEGCEGEASGPERMEDWWDRRGGRYMSCCAKEKNHVSGERAVGWWLVVTLGGWAFVAVMVTRLALGPAQADAVGWMSVGSGGGPKYGGHEVCMFHGTMGFGARKPRWPSR